MSSFICPTCGMNNIDCGHDGYKTPREIELERENTNLYLQRNTFKSQSIKRNNEKKRLKDENKHLLDLQAEQDKEIEQLLELLEECKDFITIRLDGLCGEEKENLLTSIYDAIGESGER